MNNYSLGYVRKGRRNWRAILSWQDGEGNQHKASADTGIRCYPDTKDPGTGKVTRRDTRGKGAAEDFLKGWRDRRVREEERASEVIGSTTTLYSYAEDVIKEKAARQAITPTTAEGYRGCLRHLLGTELASTPVRDVTPAQIRDWEQTLFDDRLSPLTVSHIHVFAKMVLTVARRSGDVVSNPFDLVQAPKRPRKPINSLDAAGVRKLNGLVTDDDMGPLFMAVRLALMTGMREGEICALRWQDIDRESRQIRVTHGLKKVSGGFMMGTPKSKSSTRTIPYGNALADILGARLRTMHEEREVLELDWDEGLYVIGSAQTGAWKSPAVLGRQWWMFARTFGLVGTQGVPPRFHDLRHTFATMAIASGVDVKTVSDLLGHANASMTLDVYADALADSKRAGMEIMDGVLSAV
ncbi:MAG: site-specific integrase [Atopobiaceae bacterium]|jgi:integrase|nr:site-specific integrase [Atopobiaceae bacterium]